MSAQFISHELQKFWDFGRSLRSGGSLPRFADFDLMEIHDLSPGVIILDLHEPGGRFMNRFVGTGVVELFGETTGKFVDEVDLGEFKDQLISVYRQTIATRVPHWSLAQVVRTERLAGVVDSLKKFSYERLAYPLCDENGDISHLTAIVTSCPLEEAKQGFASEAVPWPD